ncbi:40S ribosomal protein S15 [Trichuris trichiura]|uniref:40S ribosomal protein S15 n=1 Tax=Trichuris trichiura TaxID=36087 RepID=A0A077ZFS8_TRITR|nr:40S ribosomal protein S15 [Trichuris trichiura]
MEDAQEAKKKRTFKKYSYRGVDLENLLDLNNAQLGELMHARARRRLKRGLRRKHFAFLKRLRKAKKDAGALEKPAVIKTHLRDMIVLPEMIGNLVGIHNGKQFNAVEIRPEMVGHYLGEFSITYKPVKHGRPGIGATHSSRFIPLK